jgi:hypothetical protein
MMIMHTVGVFCCVATVFCFGGWCVSVAVLEKAYGCDVFCVYIRVRDCRVFSVCLLLTA